MTMHSSPMVWRNSPFLIFMMYWVLSMLYSSEDGEQPATQGFQSEPPAGVALPGGAVGGVVLLFADGFGHESHHLVDGGLFGLGEVAVALQDEGIAVATDDAVEDDAAGGVARQYHGAGAEVVGGESSQGDAVAAVYEEGVHAVAPHGDGHGAPFGDEARHFGE